MSRESIEARTAELMPLHKEQLARRVAIFEHLAEESSDGLEEAFDKREADANEMQQGADPEITDVPAASTEPEKLDPETLEPIPEGTLPPCAGTNCGTTTAEHSPECVAEHEAVLFEKPEGADGASTVEGADAAEPETPASTDQPLAALSAAEEHIEATKDAAQ